MRQINSRDLEDIRAKINKANQLLYNINTDLIKLVEESTDPNRHIFKGSDDDLDKKSKQIYGRFCRKHHVNKAGGNDYKEFQEACDRIYFPALHRLNISTVPIRSWILNALKSKEGTKLLEDWTKDYVFLNN